MDQVNQSDLVPFYELPITVAVASRQTGIPASSLREKARNGQIKAKRDGKLFYFLPSDLFAWHQELRDAKEIRNNQEKPPARSRGNATATAKRQNSLYGHRDRSKDLRAR